MHGLLAVVLIFSVGTVLGKECDCGRLCEQFKGKEVDKTCYYIAEINVYHGTQFLVGSDHDESIIVDTLLTDNSTTDELFIATKSSYILNRFHGRCFGRNCRKTVYESQCECTLNFFEKILSSFSQFYHQYTEIFWSIVTVVVVFLIICFLKCFIC